MDSIPGPGRENRLGSERQGHIRSNTAIFRKAPRNSPSVMGRETKSAFDREKAFAFSQEGFTST